MLKSVEQRLLVALLVTFISAAVVMYGDMRELKALMATVIESQRGDDTAKAEVRGEIRRLNNHIMNHERRPHGRDVE